MIFPFGLRFLVISVLALQVLGQNSVQTFGWKFREDFLSTRLQVCFEVRLVVFPNLKNATAGNFSGIPPYYMMAFPQGGQPTTTLIGVDNDTLAWAPNYPVGTKLILVMMDAAGNTGGTSASLFEIVENPNTNSCISPPPPRDFTITSNITQDGEATLETCEAWRLNINGGTPPYKIILDARNSPVITNITLPATADALVYINRADPGTALFGAIDAYGRWATGTQFASTAGLLNVNCNGPGTIPATQQELNQEDMNQRAKEDVKYHISIGIFVLTSSVLLFLAAAGIRSCRQMQRELIRLPGREENTMPALLTETESSEDIRDFPFPANFSQKNGSDLV